MTLRSRPVGGGGRGRGRGERGREIGSEREMDGRLEGNIFWGKAVYVSERLSKHDILWLMDSKVIERSSVKASLVLLV